MIGAHCHYSTAVRFVPKVLLTLSTKSRLVSPSPGIAHHLTDDESVPSQQARMPPGRPSEPDPIVLYRCVLFRQYNHQDLGDLHASHKLPDYVGLDV